MSVADSIKAGLIFKTEKQVIKEKPKTEKQQEQIDINAGPDKNDPESKRLHAESVKWNYIKKINEGKKSEIELKKIRAEVIDIETIAVELVGYLTALNQNIMEMPKGFFDEFHSGMKSKKSRADLIDIITKPICEAIQETKIRVTKTIKKERDKAHREELKQNKKKSTVNE